MSVEVPVETKSDTVRTPPPKSEPCVEVVGNVPVEIKQATTHCVIDMTEEEREKFYKRWGPEHYARYCEAKKNGCFSRCRKTDWCKVECEKKEKEQKDKEELLQTLRERNKMLEAWARDAEAKTRKMEERMEKMASLIAQLIPK